MTDAKYKKISKLLNRYAPEFAKREYPMFIAFLESYLEWCELEDSFNPWNSVNNLLDFSIIDSSIDKFAEYFRNTYIDNIPTTALVDKSLLVKHVKELYRSKGTQKSFKFLIKLLFNENSEVYYPNRYIMKSSDALWLEKKAIKTTYTDLRVTELVNTKIHGESSNATAIVESIEILNNDNGLYTLIYVSNIKGTFLSDERIIGCPPDDPTNYVYETIFNCISEIEIEDGGNDYEVGDRLESIDGIDFVATIKSIKSGSLDDIVITNPGADYSVGDIINFNITGTELNYSQPRVLVSSVDINGAITGIDIKYKGYGFTKTPTVSNITTTSGHDAVLTCLSNDAGAIKAINISNNGMDFEDPASVYVISSDGSGAILSVVLGAVGITYGSYKVPGSLLSDIFILQDSEYYQEYSYTMKTTISLSEDNILSMNNYREIFKKIVHPAGFKLFSEFILRNDIDLSQYGLWSTLTLGTGYDTNTLYFYNVLEMISYYDRIIDQRIIFQYRKDLLSSLASRTLDSFVKTGGSYITNTIELL